MFLLNGQPLSVGRAFTYMGIQYPANWLQLASEAEKAAISITWVADPVRADDRFYWDGDISFTPQMSFHKDDMGDPLILRIDQKIIYPSDASWFLNWSRYPSLAALSSSSVTPSATTP